MMLLTLIAATFAIAAPAKTTGTFGGTSTGDGDDPCTWDPAYYPENSTQCVLCDDPDYADPLKVCCYESYTKGNKVLYTRITCPPTDQGV